MDPFEVFAYWDSKENQPQLTLTLTYLALTPPSLAWSRSMQQQTQIYQLMNHHWTRLPVPSVNYEMVVQPRIPPELLKCAINPISKALHEIFIQVWRTGHVPSDWKDGILIALYKGKGRKVDCSSYRPITLLSVPGKVFAHVLLARIQPLIDLTRRLEQSGFVAGCSTIDTILALRLLSELHREFDRPLNVVYLDIKAAFDSVDRRALWKVLRSRGVPAILLDLISALHDGTAV